MFIYRSHSRSACVGSSFESQCCLASRLWRGVNQRKNVLGSCKHQTTTRDTHSQTQTLRPYPNTRRNDLILHSFHIGTSCLMGWSMEEPRFLCLHAPFNHKMWFRRSARSQGRYAGIQSARLFRMECIKCITATKHRESYLIELRTRTHISARAAHNRTHFYL